MGDCEVAASKKSPAGMGDNRKGASLELPAQLAEVPLSGLLSWRLLLAV